MRLLCCTFSQSLTKASPRYDKAHAWPGGDRTGGIEFRPYELSVAVSVGFKSKVSSGPSEDGEELLATMVSGSDGCSSLIAFTIGRGGKMHRFHLAGRY